MEEIALALRWIVLPALVGLAPAYAAARRSSGLFALFCLIGAPVAFFLLGQALAAAGAFGYDERCDEECWGNLALYVVVVSALAGWELGVLAGWAHAAWRRR